MLGHSDSCVALLRKRYKFFGGKKEGCGAGEM